jgi:amino acid transporter
MALTFAIPDVQGTLDAGVDAIPYILTTALNEQWTGFLLFIVVIGQFFCGTSSVQAASRMMFAFSRDGAVPGSRLWRKVSRNRSPVNAVIAIGVLAWLLMVPSLFIAVAYVVATSIAVIGLSIAFGLPILLRIRAGSSFERGAWSLGRHYKWISPLAVCWIVLICILFLLPVSPSGVPGAEDFDWELFNYAPLTVGGALILFGGWYLFSARHWFTGPVRETGSDLSLDEIENEVQRSQHVPPGAQDLPPAQGWAPPPQYPHGLPPGRHEAPVYTSRPPYRP